MVSSLQHERCLKEYKNNYMWADSGGKQTVNAHLLTQGLWLLRRCHLKSKGINEGQQLGQRQREVRGGKGLEG